ncbi:MAG TPA: type VI secretion system baseplate subunit TssK [Candidatus Acidoferrales bacterium]|jgi:type VI secretion system protein ImpJ|nr:type VI secretion system baseplate subunit TssK [Candidatus Acidoferrales bacterium]
MKFLSRVVWAEGMYLGPQQFQAQNRYFEESLHFASTTLNYRPYGLIGCNLDAEALSNGTVSLIHARGLFADGLAFHMPESDPLPPAREIGGLFPPTRENLTVRLAIPARQAEGVNCAFPDSVADSRYLAEMRSFIDESTGTDERPVQVGRKRFRLLLDTEPQEGFVSLAIARIVRDGSGHYIYDPIFIPACVQVSASERLLLILRQLLEIMEQKSATLSGGAEGKSTEYSARDLASFWLLHSVNSAAAVIRHLWTSKRGHPEEVFLELSRLAGALCTFTLDSHPRSLPVYDHENLTGCFEALERHIRTHLEIILPVKCLQISLQQTANYFYEGEVTDARCLGRARWVFGIHSEAGEVELIRRTPQLVKICSSKFVGELVKRALAGLELTHLEMPPLAVQAKMETQYFGIDRSGPFWDSIKQTRRVGIYVPGELPNPELELLVVLD